MIAGHSVCDLMNSKFMLALSKLDEFGRLFYEQQIQTERTSFLAIHTHVFTCLKEKATRLGKYLQILGWAVDIFLKLSPTVRELPAAWLR